MDKSFFVKLILVGVILSGVTTAFANNLITATRVWPADDYTRVTIEAKDPVKYKTFTLKNPERLVVDIEKAALNDEAKSLAEKVLSNDPYIKKIRVAQFQPDVIRVVVDLKQEVNFNVFSLEPAGEYQHRLVLDVIPTKDPLIAMLDQLDKDKASQDKKETTPQSVKKQEPRIITIAIDAGHGGEDPGATGAKGSKEKHITLAIAKRLKKIVDAEPNMRGVLTRKDDYFISLGGRVVKAKKLKADLFISIHADAFTKPSARGSSVFALSERGATSATARYLAQKENQSDLIGGVSLKNKDPMLTKTLIDLTFDATITDSLKLGKAVLGHVGEVNQLHKKHVEQANFAVLRSDIPSILVETAFISNPQEERKLNSSHHQDKLAESIMLGIKKYFAANPALARNDFPEQ